MLSSLWKSSPSPSQPQSQTPSSSSDKMPPISPPTNNTPSPPAPLVSTWRARADAGEPVAAVRVRNLASAIPVGRDAWGRSGRTQPVLVSSEVSFAHPFTGGDGVGTGSKSGETDRLDGGTVHYGTLSKTLLGSLERWGQGGGKGGAGGGVVAEGSKKDGKQAKPEGPRTADVLDLLWAQMTGRVVDGSRVALPLDQVPFLDATRLRSLSLTVGLPKASLLGAGVSLTTVASFRGDELKDGDDDDKDSKNPLRSYSRSLKIQGLHVPTLVGVNSNERKAKQMIVAEIEIDRFDVAEDIHSDLEKLVVDTMEATSFQTLEALASHVANKILSDFRIGDDPAPMKDRGWQVRVCLEKPIAVPFAECPSIEVIIGP
ncbi:Dihydroneopterin aldolase-domain-containing protein [Hypomontagnella monticulosa]|nr:Dihydroneopterin aldolase-domain-containing protein [Hypomontagnella monticulosa]